MTTIRTLLHDAVAVIASGALVCSFAPATALAADTMRFDYTGSYSGAIEADGEEVSASGETYTATEKDVNAGLAQNGGTLTLDDVKLVKSGSDSDGDSCNFYGVNSILLAVNSGSKAVVSDSALTASGEGSNGVFATDSATAYANNVSISTSADNSRGLDATYGGTVVASNLSISTEGAHCAGIATDRGGGYVSATSSEIATEGDGSPILYSTGDIEVSGLTGSATGSQLCGMEGLNTILINDSTLESSLTRASGSDPVADGVIIYQSTSGDAESSTGETATFQAVDSSLASAIASGSMFYFTNTTADVVLEDTTLDFDSDKANLILAAGNDSNNWGSAGRNGATVTFTGIAQTLEGDVEADAISSVDLYLTDGTTWTGAGEISANSSGSTSDEPLCVNVDSSSTWVVTEDCTISTLSVAEGGSVVDTDGDTASIAVDGQTVVEGTSSLTVTVDEYDTAYSEKDEGTLETDLIDRSSFDATFGTSTTFALGDETETGKADVDASAGSSAGSSSGGSSTAATSVDLSGATVALSKKSVKLTTKKGRKVAVTSVKLDGKTLKRGSDYEVSYSDYKKIGTATVTVKGTGDYTGAATATYKITPAQGKIKAAKPGKNKVTLKLAKKPGKVSYQIAYKVKGTKKWKRVSSRKTTKTVKKLKSGTTYKFKIRAYKKVGGKKIWGTWSKGRIVKVK